MSRIVELTVEKIAAVDHPANRRRFLIVKNEQGRTTREEADAPDAMRSMRDGMRDLIRKALNHPKAHVIGTLDDITTWAEATNAELRDSLHKIVKGELTGAAAEAEVEKRAYDHERAQEQMLAVLEKLREETERHA